MNPDYPAKPSALVRLLVWLRSQSWLRSAYHAMPRLLRERALHLLTWRLRRRTRFVHTGTWRDWRPIPPMSVVPGLPIGSGVPAINIMGYIHGQFGLAEAARSYARALIENGVPVALRDFDFDLPNARGEHALDVHIDNDVPHAISIIFVNPDYMERALAELGQARREGRYLIACWFWELEAIPQSWLSSLELVDEVLVATSFVEQAVKRVTSKPVLRVPMPLGDQHDSGLQRVDFGLPEDAFVFLASFDFSSRIERKNPAAVIQAFLLAFPKNRNDVRLLVKSSNGHRFPHWLRHLLALAGGDDRIIIRDEVIEREHLSALQRCCDAYVSLHRAEGFGLGLAECMAIGKPVIATAWSGNMEFMDADCAALVGYTLVPVKAGEYPQSKGLRWADADVGQAAGWMRTLADDPALAADMGLRGKRHVEAVLSGQNAARQIIARACEIEAARRVNEKPEQGGQNRD